jgi:RNA polymerase sigma-70 factor (ECF subfamily)
MDVTLAEIIGSMAASSPSSMPEAPADAEITRLAIRARAGDPGAFCALVDLHQRAARRVAMAALGRPAEADEAVQDACVTAWQRIASLDDPSAFRAWLLRITWRKALDRRRSITKWLRRITAVDDVPDGFLVSRIAARMRAVDDELVARECDRVVAQMIRSLPARLRDPFLLAAAGERRYDDIAAMLGMPVGTVKWRVSEARRVLREKLARVGIGMEGGASRPRARR